MSAPISLAISASRSGDIGAANHMLFAQIRRQEHPIAQGIDPARHAAGGPMDGDEGIGFELRITFPADKAKPVFDVSAGVGLIERAKVI